MERKIVIFCDIDKTQNHLAPPPIRTMASLIMGKLTVPELGQPLKPAKRSGKLNLFFHRIRPFTKDSQVGLEVIRQTADETNRSIELDILSGRNPSLHGMTIHHLYATGRAGCFDEIYLSYAGSSSGYKEMKAMKEVQKGNSVVLIDDDLKPALMVARLQEQCQEGQVVLGFLLANISNHPRLLRRAGIELPGNVERVSSFQAGAHSLVARIHGGLI